MQLGHGAGHAARGLGQVTEILRRMLAAAERVKEARVRPTVAAQMASRRGFLSTRLEGAWSLTS
jgi:hypothetical protein